MVSDPHCEEILNYTEQVLQELGFRNGAIHGEIMYVAGRGPVLVEINCRLHGGNGAWVRPAALCMKVDQLSLLLDVYLHEGKNVFADLPSRPTKAYAHCQQVKLRSHLAGTLDCVIPSQLERIQALPSYLEHFISVRPGEQLLKTIDMPSVPGECTLVHEDKEQLAHDYELLNEILREGIFQIVE